MNDKDKYDRLVAYINKKHEEAIDRYYTTDKEDIIREVYFGQKLAFAAILTFILYLNPDFNET
jgi:hypothetical protein